MVLPGSGGTISYVIDAENKRMGRLDSDAGGGGGRTGGSITIPRPPAKPETCPGKGWEWRGRGAPGSDKGAWYNSSTRQSLHPDLRHPEPIGPHWDYTGPEGAFRIFPDGRVEPK